MADNTNQHNASLSQTGIPGRAELEDICSSLCADVVSAIEKSPRDFALHKQILHDLNDKLVDTAARLEENEIFGVLRNKNELLWSLAGTMPPFDTESLYEKRSSLTAMAAAVFLGWLAGGLLSTLLGFFALGGEIIRPLAIFGAIWLSEYLAGNPRARRILLTILGLGGLTRFATLVVGGMFRFTGISSLRTAVFGSARAGFFKSFWLLGGAFFVLILLAKKVSGLDVAAFRQSLRNQSVQRLKLLCFVLAQLAQRDHSLRNRDKVEKDGHKDRKCLDGDCQLANAVMEVLNSLDADRRAFLRASLEAAGFHLPASADADDFLVWDSEKHSQLYDTIGLVRDGDRCRILKQPYVADGKTIKGHVQKAAE